jgi:hypothetical protein
MPKFGTIVEKATGAMFSVRSPRIRQMFSLLSQTRIFRSGWKQNNAACTSHIIGLVPTFMPCSFPLSLRTSFCRSVWYRAGGWSLR